MPAFRNKLGNGDNTSLLSLDSTAFWTVYMAGQNLPSIYIILLASVSQGSHNYLLPHTPPCPAPPQSRFSCSTSLLPLPLLLRMLPRAFQLVCSAAQVLLQPRHCPHSILSQQLPAWLLVACLISCLKPHTQWPCARCHWRGGTPAT